MYVYIETEHNADGSLYTVGFYHPNGKWESDGDYDDRENAAARVAYLNGLNEKAPDEIGISHVKHYQINGRFKMQFERSAVKGIDGFKVEANSDNLEDVISQAKTLKEYAEAMTKPAPVLLPEVK